MSLLNKIFGGKSHGNQSVTAQEAIQRLRDIEETLQKKSDYIETTIERQQNFARLNAHKNKRAALLALKRKKRLEGQLRQIDGSLTTIEFQRESLESAATNNAVLSAMRDAKDALKKAQGGLDVDEVHDLMDEIVEQNEVGNEIAEAISRPAFGLNEIDEDELNDELEALTQEGIDDQLTKLEDRASELPEVPSDKIPVGSSKSNSKTEEEEELSQLMAFAT